jgi:hypothetical protein
MPFPTLDEMQALFKRLPMVGLADIDRAKLAAGKTLEPERSELLCASINQAFRNYLVERLWDLWTSKAPAAKTAAQIQRIAAAADKLADLLEISGIARASGQRGRINELYRMIVLAQAGLYAQEIGGFPDLPPRMFDSVTAWSNDPSNVKQVIQRPDYRADEKLGQLIDALQLWRQILHRAHKYERRKVTPTGNRKRRAPNKALHVLYCTLNSVWETAFDELPADGWNPATDSADGPYFRFLDSIFDLWGHTSTRSLPRTTRSWLAT